MTQQARGNPRVSRRGFLRGAAALATATAVPGLWPVPAVAQDFGDLPRRRPVPVNAIGQQWFMIRDALAQDFEGTWAAVAAMGIRNVELGPPLFGRSAADLRDLFDSLGLRVISRMLSLSIIRNDFDSALQDCRTLGTRYVRSNVLPAADRSSLDAYRRVAEDFNIAGEAARRAGMQFGHHNHAEEFTPIDGVVPMELLLAATDPRLFDVQLDIYWAAYAGADVVEFMNTYGRRVGTFHLKDMNPDGSQTDVGSGIIDFPAVFAAGLPQRRREYIFDLDNPADGLQSVANSFSYLKQLRY